MTPGLPKIAAAVICLLAVACSRPSSKQERAAVAASIATKAVAIRSAKPDVAGLVAAAAYQMSPGFAERNALLLALQADPQHAGYLPQATAVKAAAYSHDGQTLVTVGDAGTICRWNLAKRSSDCIQLDDNKVELRNVAVYPGQPLAVAVSDSSSHVRYIFFGNDKPEVTDLGGGNAVAFDPTGVTLAAPKNNGDIRLWSLMSGKPEPDAMWSGHQAATHNVAFNEEGSRMLSVDDKGVAVVHDMTTGKVASSREFGTGAPPLVAMGGQDIAAVANAGSGNVTLWKLSGNTVVNLSGDAGNAVTGLAFSPEGTMLAVASSNGTVTTWDPATAKASTPLRTGSGPLQAIAFAPDGLNFAAISAHGIWLFRNAAPGSIPARILKTGGPTAGLAFTPDAKKLLVAGSPGGPLSIDVATGRPRTFAFADPASADAIAISPDGKLVAAANAETFDISFFDISTGKPEGKPLHGHTARVTSLAFRADGQALASAAADGTARLWDSKTGAPVCAPVKLTASGSKETPQVALLPNQMVLTLSGGTLSYSSPCAAGSHSQTTGSIGGNALAASNDGKLAAVAVDDAIYLAPDSLQFTPEVFASNTGNVISLAFSADAKTLASIGADGTIRLWDVASKTALGDPFPAGGVTALAFSPDGKLLAAGRDGKVALIPFDSASWLSLACQNAGRDLTRAEWEQYVGKNAPYQKTCSNLAAAGGPKVP